MAIADLTKDQLYGQMFDQTTGAVRTTGGGGAGGDGATGPLGRRSDATSVSVALSTEDMAALSTAANQSTANASLASIDGKMSPGEYETVAASQTAQALGATGATGDYLEGLLVIPATTAPGNVLLLDNAISITVFTGGTGSVATLIPFFIPIGSKSVSGAWKVTTGANVSVFATGNFT